MPGIRTTTTSRGRGLQPSRLPPLRRGGPEGGPPEGGPILDTSTLANDHHDVITALGQRIGLARHRRVWSRVFLGMTLPGRYYFLTLTSSEESPPIEKTWHSLIRWLRRHRPGLAHIHVLTSEGHGVAHLVVRLTYGQENIDVRELRRYWRGTHHATQIRIERVRDYGKLSRYLSEQAKKGTARELRYQPDIIAWRYTRNWLPVGFTAAWGRFYHRHAGRVSQETIDRVTAEWLRAAARRPEALTEPPRIEASPRA